MRTLESIYEIVNKGSAKVISDGDRLKVELLWEILQRMDFLVVGLLGIEVLDYVVNIDIGTTETLIYHNVTDRIVSIRIYNTDPAQTVHLGKTGVTINNGVPIFHEQSLSARVEPGDSIYGIVTLGSVDVRYSVSPIM